MEMKTMKKKNVWRSQLWLHCRNGFTLLHSKKSWFFFASTKRRKLPRFVLCFTVRFKISSHFESRLYHFWVRFLGPFWANDENCRAENGAQKWNPKQGSKLDPKIKLQNEIRGPKFTRMRKQSLHDLLGDRVQLCNKLTTNQRRKGNLGGQNCSKSEHEYIHRPHIVKTCFTCKRYIVKSHAWKNQQHACYCICPQCFQHLVMAIFFSWWKSTYQDRTTGFITYLTARTDFVGWLRDIAAQCINQDKTRAVKISHGVLLTFYILNHILFVLPGKLLKNIKVFQLVPQPKLGQHHYKKVTDLYSNWNRLAVAETKTFPPEDLLSRCLDPNSSWTCIPISNAFSAGIWDA